MHRPSSFCQIRSRGVPSLDSPPSARSSHRRQNGEPIVSGGIFDRRADPLREARG
jgi:hypothetical protein